MLGFRKFLLCLMCVVVFVFTGKDYVYSQESEYNKISQNTERKFRKSSTECNALRTSDAPKVVLKTCAGPKISAMSSVCTVSKGLPSTVRLHFRMSWALRFVSASARCECI